MKVRGQILDLHACGNDERHVPTGLVNIAYYLAISDDKAIKEEIGTFSSPRTLIGDSAPPS